MNYSDYVSQVAALLNISATIISPGSSSPSSTSDFNVALPGSIAYAENRIQRDADLPWTMITDETGTLTVNNRSFTLPGSSPWITVTQAYLLVSGAREMPMLPISYEALSAIYPSSTALSPAPSYPVYWAPVNGTTILVGPAPDTAYGIGIVGTQRVTELSATNATNIISTLFPDLYIAAAMIFWSGYERDFGAQSGDPAMAMSWETQYEKLLLGAKTDTARQRFQSQGWNARLPSPIATPPQN